MNRNFVLAALAIALSSQAASAEKKPQVTGLELQQIQSRDYEADVTTVFPAVMTVLQDAGYRINAADRDTGLITGQASTDSKTTFNIFWGLGKKKKTPVVSAFIEPRGPNIARVRLSFVMAETKSRAYGVASADEEPIADPAVYRDAFEKIDKEVFVRQAMAAAPVPAPVSSVAQATTMQVTPKVKPAVANSFDSALDPIK
jgi:hypothetical protein